MRSSKKRSRSNQNRPRSLGNIVNRVFDSSGPEGKVRGTPQQIIEKYQTLARDAQLSNDRVAAENFLQHAEHYTRMLAEAQRELAIEQEARQQQYQQNGNGQSGGQNGGQGGNREFRDRNDRNDRGDRGGDRNAERSDRGENRNEQRGPRDGGSRDGGPREDRTPQPTTSDVIDFGGESSGLVDLPESSASVEPAVPASDTPLFATARNTAAADPQPEPGPDAPAERAADDSERDAKPARASRAPRGDKSRGDKPARNTVRQPRAEAAEGGDEPAAEGSRPRRTRSPRKAATTSDAAPEATPDAPEAAE